MAARRAVPGLPRLRTGELRFDVIKTLPEIRVSGRIVRREQIQALLATQSAAGIGIEVAQPGALGRLLGDPRLAEDSPDAML